MGSHQLPRALARTPNWLGDAVLAFPAITCIVRSMGESAVTLVSHVRVAPLYERKFVGVEVVTFDPERLNRGVGGLVRFSRRLRRAEGYEWGFVYPPSISSAVMIRLAGIHNRVGYASFGRGWLLTHCMPKLRRGTVHLVDEYLGLCEPAGIPIVTRSVELVPSQEDLASGKRDLIGAGWAVGSPLVGIAPGARYGPAKQWPADRYAALADRLWKERGLSVVQLGSAGDREVGARVQSMVSSPIIDLMGKTTLCDLIGILPWLRLLVTNDSGIMHLAAAIGTPVIALFGSTDPKWTGPRGEGHRIIRHPVPCSPCFRRTCRYSSIECLESIVLDEVMEGIQVVLDRGGESYPTSRFDKTMVENDGR